MGLTKIKNGLDLPITGQPEQVISDGNKVKSVALVGYDYVGMKPTMLAAVGDTVKLGQVLFTDKKNPAVKHTSPGAGKIVAINRGAKRVFESLVIELEGDEEITFNSYSEDEIKKLEREKVVDQLIESGQWTFIRNRPFSKVADPAITPRSIFVTAMDSNPLAPSVEQILKGKEKEFANGLTVISKLTAGKLFVCKYPNEDIPSSDAPNVLVENFTGPHPAGNAGTHIHFLDPADKNRNIWSLNAQDVAAIGNLFLTGKIDVERVVSIAGPSVNNPRLVKTRLGASLSDLTKDEINDDENRIISGSVISGRNAHDTLAYLGRYHQQVSVLREGRERKFFGWLSPGFNLYSAKNIVFSKLFFNKKFDFTTAIHGGHRGIVPIGLYEKVMPLDIMPTFLLKSLAVDDVEEAEKLGCFELDEEDLALCTFVCPSKIDHGVNLRRVLNIIEKEG